MPKTKGKSAKIKKVPVVSRGRLIVTSLVFIFLFLSISNLLPKTKPPDENLVLGTKEASLENSKVYWEKFLQENPAYFDGWLELAKIYYDLGYMSGTLEALEEASKIDPNSEEVADTKKLLGL